MPYLIHKANLNLRDTIRRNVKIDVFVNLTHMAIVRMPIPIKLIKQAIVQFHKVAPGAGVRVRCTTKGVKSLVRKSIRLLFRLFNRQGNFQLKFIGLLPIYSGVNPLTGSNDRYAKSVGFGQQGLAHRTKLAKRLQGGTGCKAKRRKGLNIFDKESIVGEGDLGRHCIVVLVK